MQECARCRDLGHSCPGTFEEDGRPICVFCLDLTECPVQRKQRAAKKNTPPDETPPAAGESEKAANEPHDEVKSMQNTESDTPKICAKPGCTIQLSAANTSGRCRGHVRWQDRSSSAPEKTNGHAHAATNGAGEKANGANGHTPKNGNGHAAAAVDLAVDVIEERLNRLFLNLPVAEKSLIAARYLRGEI
jgi:hypothetical protein